MLSRLPSRRRLVALLALAVAIGSLGIWLIRDPYRAQDACAFGSAGNDRYREFLAQARDLVDEDRQVFASHFSSRNIQEGTDLLFRRQQQLQAGLTHIDDRIAAMHALARAYGARFTNTLPDTPDPWGATPDVAPDTIRFVYSLKVDRFSGWLPIRRWIRLTGEFAIRDVGAGFERAREIHRDTLLMFATGSGTAPQIAPPSPSQFHVCPPVPSPGWWAAFNSPPVADPASTTSYSSATVAPLVQLADGFVERGRPRLAISHLDRALAIANATLGQDSQATIGILDRLGRIYRVIGQPSKAAEYEGLALDARIRAQPPGPSAK